MAGGKESHREGEVLASTPTATYKTTGYVNCLELETSPDYAGANYVDITVVEADPLQEKVSHVILDPLNGQISLCRKGLKFLLSLLSEQEPKQ